MKYSSNILGNVRDKSKIIYESRTSIPGVLFIVGLITVMLPYGSALFPGFGIAGFAEGAIWLVYVGLAASLVGLSLDLTLGDKVITKWIQAIFHERVKLGYLLIVSAEFGLIVLLIHQFQIENRIFYEKIIIITFYGFLIHSILPIRLRMPFFLALFLISLRAVFGFTEAAWLLGIGLALILILYIPIPFSARLIIMLLAGGFLAVSRADWITAPWPTAIWPILGSIFMFRLIVYIYDLRHEKTKPSIIPTLSYFFLFPNLIFPLFPVVDYKTFRRTYYDEKQHWIYLRGVQWMFRGIAQLILYRLVYYYLTISPLEVENIFDLIRYLVTNFALYLRVSGLFHLIVGMLHLFGFNLPETNFRYFLASGFTDLWRRINIYWKDFMMKVFYYPAYFWLKKWGGTLALIISTIFVFFVTWVLHSYQWFWFRGSFLLTWVDILFWATLGLLVVINSLYEAKHGRKRSIGKKSKSWKEILSLSLRIIGTFSVMAILWSLWVSPTLSDWFSLWSLSGVSNRNEINYASVGIVAALVIVGMSVAELGGTKGINSKGKKPLFVRSAVITSLGILIIYLLGTPIISSRFGISTQEVIRDIKVEGLNQQDAALMQRGYYEDLSRVERFNSKLWEVYIERQDYWPKISETEASRLTDDFLKIELVPLKGIQFHGAPLRTNRWGMRDQDYELNKPPSTFRFALLGPSHVMGSGVADNEIFESLVEERLNSNPRLQQSWNQFEILNFAVASYTPLQYLWVFENKAVDFQPDAVLYIAYPSDPEFAINHLVDIVQTGAEIPYQFLNQIVQDADINLETQVPLAEKNLAPYGLEIIDWTYSRIAQKAREENVVPLWVLLATPGIDPQEKDFAILSQIAADAGFIVIDLSEVFKDQDPKSLQIAEWDWHPNALGHKLIADQLYTAVLENWEQITNYDK